MFWTAGWAALLGSAGAIAGVVGTSVTAVVGQRSTTKRELMLADRTREEQLHLAERTAITDLFVAFSGIYQTLIDNVGELLQSIVTNFKADAQTRLKPAADKLISESADISNIPAFLIGDPVVPHTFPEQLGKSLAEAFPQVERRFLTLELMIADADFQASLSELRAAWKGLATAWNAAKFLATNWDIKKPPDNELPPETTDLTQAFIEWQKKYTDFFSAAQKYLRKDSHA